MPKLPRVSGKRLARVLEKAGFRTVRIRGDHAFMAHPDGRRAVVVLSGGTLPVGTIAGTIAEAGLTSADLRRLLD
ncbi:MAG TPA: type II toxin-antitoxin system HicA family toxin [Armatimonadota bacterium]